jgi:ribonuclease T1
MKPPQPFRHGLAGAITLAVTLGLAAAGCGSAAASGSPSNTRAACSTSSAVPSGMKVLTTAQLPAQALATLRLIAAGGPYPYAQDNTIFGNYGGTLPRERYGYYREFTVQTPGAESRGVRRVVIGSGGEDYYTSDHYATFAWIACAR